MRALAACALALVILGLPGVAFAEGFNEGAGEVTAVTSDDAVELRGSQGGSGGASAGPDSSGDAGDAAAVTVIPPGTARCYQTDEAICVADRAAPTQPPADPGPVTIQDLAVFPVTSVIAHNQPTGWGVVGRPTNFYTTGGTHTVTGDLLGQPATVRFTPVGWHWDYGDNTTAHLTNPGQPWTKESQLRETPTSHVYEAKADYTITLSVDYAAEYQYAGQPWVTVPGYLRVPANDLHIITWNVKTRLVAHNCIDDPKGPGCPGTLTR